jgi:hypothetical protein
LTSGFEPLFDYEFTIGPDTAYGSLSTTNVGNGEFLATAGFLTVTGGNDNGADLGTYSLYQAGQTRFIAPAGTSFTIMFSTPPSTP